MFVQDLPNVMKQGQPERLFAGQLFGEVSALTRSPRISTVIADTHGTYLEMRWQGFRDLLQRSPELKRHVDEAYRQHSLHAHLRETPILKHLSETQVTELAERTELKSFGRMQWTHEHRSMIAADISERINQEPIIACQGEYVDSLLLIRSGFARITRRQGVGEQTIEYLGRGRHFGLREIAHNHLRSEQHPWQLSLRAIGYVDVLRIPIDAVEDLVLPGLPADLRPPPLATPRSRGNPSSDTRRQSVRQQTLDTRLLENLVERRLINGTEAMVIDLNRCTRCDDCVRACATAHDGNPRFVRDGFVQDQWMFANACMHCQDPVCMIGCPTGAISREEETGVITINDQTCIGCQTCAQSCPYGSIQMVEIRDEKGLPIVDISSGDPVLQATKCDLCIDQSGGPACQRACPHDALIRVDLSTPSPLTAWIKG